jgi:hypothetical protein
MTTTRYDLLMADDDWFEPDPPPESREMRAPSFAAFLEQLTYLAHKYGRSGLKAVSNKDTRTVGFQSPEGIFMVTSDLIQAALPNDLGPPSIAAHFAIACKKAIEKGERLRAEDKLRNPGLT